MFLLILKFVKIVSAIARIDLLSFSARSVNTDLTCSQELAHVSMDLKKFVSSVT